MYFTNFPLTLYTLDNGASAQLVKNIFIRFAVSNEIKNNISIYDEYDIRDDETPEILADKIYSNPELHWLVLHLNNILDPRFEWPLSTNKLSLYVQGKYNDVNGIKHYINDETGEIVNGNVFLYATSSGFANFNAGDVVINNTGEGVGYVTSKINDSNVNVIVTVGGFKSGDVVKPLSNSLITANLLYSSTTPGITAVTNSVYEDEENETRRRIKLLKPQFVQTVMSELNNKLEEINGQ